MVRNILVDTSAIYAFISQSDQFHTQSRETYSEILERGDRPTLYHFLCPGRIHSVDPSAIGL